MNREECEALQGIGIRVDAFRENCGHCHRPSTYKRSEDRYYHDDLSVPNLPCWFAISSGQPPLEPAVSQRDSPARRSYKRVAV